MRSVISWFRKQPESPVIETDSVESSEPNYSSSPVTGLFSQLFTGGLVLTLLLAAAGLIGVVVGYVVRSVDPQTQVILAGFTGPFDLRSDAGNSLGKQSSDIFSDSVNEIIEIGSSYSGNQKVSSKSRGSEPFDPVPQVPISRNYGIAIQGISIDQIISIWHSIRYYQETVSGDIIPVATTPGKYVLYLSWRIGTGSYNWTSTEFSANDKEMELAIRNAAIHFVRETNPEIAGRFYLSQEQFSQAVSTFSDWVGREPSRPEPYIYLAKTYDSTGDFGRALPFADRAQQLLSGAPRRGRAALQTNIYRAESLGFFDSKDPDSAKSMDSYVQRNLSNDTNAKNNVGLRYLEKGDYADAERTLKESADKGGYTAALILGESYNAHKDFGDARNAYRMALNTSPESALAATGYVKSLLELTDFDDATIFCDSWLYPEGGPVGLISQAKSNDLFFYCAESEQQSKQAKHDRLSWYYVQSLIRPDSEEPEVTQAIADSQMLITMHDDLCTVKNEDIPPDQDRGQWINGIEILETSLLKRSTIEPRMKPLAADCAQTAEDFKSSARPKQRTNNQQ